MSDKDNQTAKVGDSALHLRTATGWRVPSLTSSERASPKGGAPFLMYFLLHFLFSFKKTLDQKQKITDKDNNSRSHIRTPTV